MVTDWLSLEVTFLPQAHVPGSLISKLFSIQAKAVIPETYLPGVTLSNHSTEGCLYGVMWPSSLGCSVWQGF